MIVHCTISVSSFSLIDYVIPLIPNIVYFIQLNLLLYSSRFRQISDNSIKGIY